MAALLVALSASASRLAPARRRRSPSAASSKRAVTLFPQDAPNDRASTSSATCWLREEVFVKPAAVAAVRRRPRPAREHARSGRGLAGASTSAIAGALRPALSVRRLAATLDARAVHRRRRQAVHPLGQDRHRHPDRPLRAARLPERHRHRVPRRDRRSRCRAGRERTRSRPSGCRVFTPSRIPLLDQRWTRAAGLRRRRGRGRPAPSFPKGSQAGIRWSHIGDADRVLAVVLRRLQPPAERRGRARPAARAVRSSCARYPPMRSYGGDAAMPTRWFTVKGEAAYFDLGSTPADRRVRALRRAAGAADRRMGFVGGYAGEARDRAPRGGDVRARPRPDAARSSAGVVHDRPESQRRVRRRGPAERPRASTRRASTRRRAASTGARRSPASLIGGEPTTFSASTDRNSHVALGASL